MRFIITLLLLLCSSSSFSVLPGVNVLEPNFKSVEANKVLNRFSLNSFTDRASARQLQSGITNLSKFSAAAKRCITDNTLILEETNKRLNQIANPQIKTAALLAEQKYLNHKKADITNKLSECSLYVMRADELTAKLTLKLRSMVKMELLYAGPTLLDNAQHLPYSIYNFYKTLSLVPFYSASGIFLLNPIMAVWLGLIILFGILIGLKLKSLLAKAIDKLIEPHFSAHFNQAFQCVLHKYIALFIPVLLFALFMTAVAQSITEPPYLAQISYAILAYLLFFMLVDLFFSPPKPAQKFSKLPEQLAKSLTYRLKSLATLLLLAFIVYVAFNAQMIPDTLIDLLTTLFITAVSINLIAIIWLVNRLPKILHRNPRFRFCISIFLSTLLLIMLVAEWFGYHLLALYLLRGTAFTALLFFILKLTLQIITSCLNELMGTERGWQQKFRKAFGLKSGEKLPEILWFRIFLYIILWFIFLLLLLKIWGVAQTAFHRLASALFYGFQIGGVNVVFSHIALGALIFIFLATSTRLLRACIARNTELQLDKGNRESLAAIAGYIGFAIAIIFGLLIAGVSFSGLAIIAGALSVGIGFGLQNIVNNFVSGLVLLIERPIKPGDRIIVGDTEGYVRKISIRATNIITLHRTDVIVPNSDLISKQVTNYMLYDTTFKISNSVGIAYGSDTQKAKALLLEIANSHPQVITERVGYEPQVYFKKFGEHSLEFEVICLIKDAELKGRVQSDINFAINKIFAENNIEIAFPQREITIRNWPMPEQRHDTP